MPELAVLIIIFTIVPAGVWGQPTVDQEYRGFDSNVVYVSAGAGSVDVTPSRVDLQAAAQVTPAITMLTTPLRRILVSLSATIVAAEGAVEPLRVGMWSPLNGSGYVVAFGPAPSNIITIDAISGGGSGKSPVGGDIVKRVSVGAYALAKPYGIKLLVDRDSGVISSWVFADGSLIGHDSVSSRDFPALFAPVRLSLTASSTGGPGSSHVTLGNYGLTLLHERFWASKVADWKAQIIFVALAAAALLMIAVAFVQHRNRLSVATDRVRGLRRASRTAVTGRRLAIGLLAGAVAVYLAGNAFLFRLGGHPFDMGGERVFAYVGATYGPMQLYYLPNLVPLAPVWQGTPYIEAGFPYGPIVAYLFAAIGWVYNVVFAGASHGYSGLQLEAAIKSVNVLFGLGDAALIYLILQRIALPQRWRLIASGLFLFNPAVWFSMSVWGQTHVISIFFVLATIWFAEKNRPAWAWAALAAALLTRPQMVVFGLLLGIVLLRKFSWERNLAAISWTTIVTFVALMPLTLATSPSLPVDILLNNFQVQEAGGNDDSVTTVSQGAFSVWPLITYLTHGASGLQRTFMPSSQSLVGPVTYRLASQVLTVVMLLVLSALLLVRKRDDFKSGNYLMIVALGIASFLMLLTGIVPTHFLLALPFFLLLRRWMGGGAYLFIGVIWTVTSFVALFGEMGAFLSSQDYPLLAPAHNAVTKFFAQLYLWDRFISVAVAANICAVVWLGLLTFRQFTSSGGSPKSPAPLASTVSEPA